MLQDLRIRTRNILKKYNLRLRKELGQNFLVSSKVLQKIIKESNLRPEDTVLEIGAGIGVLTTELAKKARKVIAVEKDSRLVSILKEILKQRTDSQIEIVEGDFFKIPNSKFQFQSREYKVVANLPYAIATRVIMKFLKTENPPKLIVAMVQREVGERICSKPPKMSKLSVFCQFYGKPTLLASVSKKDFLPSPKVDSALLKIIPNNKYRVLKNFYSAFQQKFAELVKAGFSHPRKLLVNNLSEKIGFSKENIKGLFSLNKIPVKSRAQDLAVEDWVNLTKTLF